MPSRSGYNPRIPSRSSVRRETKWSVGPNDSSGASSSGQVLWTNGVVLSTESLATIVRIRGFWDCWLTAGDAANAGFEGAIGLGLVSDEAFAAGAASVPGPISEVDWDGWMFHQFFNVKTQGAFNVASGLNMAYQRISIDCKAMRKITDGYTLCGVVEHTEIGTAVLAQEGNTRVLLKLS